MTEKPDPDDFLARAKAFEQEAGRMSGYVQAHGGGTCPNCGYCPHCQRGGSWGRPWWGINPQPYYWLTTTTAQAQPWGGTNTTFGGCTHG